MATPPRRGVAPLCDCSLGCHRVPFAHNGVEQIVKADQPIDHARHHRGRQLVPALFRQPRASDEAAIGQEHGASGFQVFQLLGKSEPWPRFLDCGQRHHASHSDHHRFQKVITPKQPREALMHVSPHSQARAICECGQ